MIIDARFNYEYKAGHIKDAINIESPQELERKFIHDLETITRHMSQNTILIFHCEFSYKRGPDLWKTLREIDRNVNMVRYPKLFYPESYIL